MRGFVKGAIWIGSVVAAGFILDNRGIQFGDLVVVGVVLFVGWFYAIRTDGANGGGGAA